MRMEALHPMIDLIEQPLPGDDGSTVVAARVLGSRHRVVVDTLLAPADVAAFGQATLAVYTHSDWDHCWGTAAFPGVPVIGHRITRDRLQSQEAQDYLAEMKRKHPARFEGASIILPDVVFDEKLEIDAGGITLQLHHMPGHTHDAVWTWIPELETVLAGDCAEDPIPSLNEPGHLRQWALELRRWARSGVKVVVPAHGRPSGPDLLERNAAYVEELLGRVAEGHSQGRSPEELERWLPVTAFLPDVDRYPAYYRSAHRTNIRTALAEIAGT